jgi:hypothetical protein
VIEWILTGLVRLVTWAWASALTLYYLAGFLIVVGGLIMFAGTVIHHLWTKSADRRPMPRPLSRA